MDTFIITLHTLALIGLGIDDALYDVVWNRPDQRKDRSIMETKVGKFSFAIPEGHAQAGDKIEKTFDYQHCNTLEEATKVIEDKKWNIVTMVNDNLKANARSNAYQAALLPYRPSEVSPEEIKERMVRDYIRLGIPEDTARKQVEALLAASAQSNESANG